MMDALVPIGEEGRSHAAISHGERPTRFDPWISEWGNLTQLILDRPRVNT
jgi:hypothetical protein